VHAYEPRRFAMPCKTRYPVERNISFFYSLDQTKVSARRLHTSPISSISDYRELNAISIDGTRCLPIELMESSVGVCSGSSIELGLVVLLQRRNPYPWEIKCVASVVKSSRIAFSPTAMILLIWSCPKLASTRRASFWLWMLPRCS
jgi:hypothetical protein